jgi:GMP synthase-like glutamine amidotransferase
MKPVAVLQHMTSDGPGYLATWLQARGRAFEVFDSEAGQAFPASMDGYGALAVLGGEMSVNDDLPSLRQAEALIRESMARGLPVIGHCLGGQLMATALGARVAASPAPEIGWQRAAVHDHAEARAWFGDAGEVMVFHWHFEAFDLPAGAVALAGSDACPCQAFSIGPHLAMQFHVEVDDIKLASWSSSRDPAFLALQQSCPTVQGGDVMRAQARRWLPAQQALASRLYARWLHAAA